MSGRLRPQRVDQALVALGLCPSRERAKRSVMAGQVRVNGHLARQPSDRVSSRDVLRVIEPERYVSRGGYKLEHGLQHFGLAVRGTAVVDLGASTGGFTDCLLQHHAMRVYAVDVGRGQLAWKLRTDPRVVVMERVNARYLTRNQFPESFEPVPLVVIDCSFISLRKVLPAATRVLRPEGRILALVKPQFEAGKKEADQGRGVIKDPAIHLRVLNELKAFTRNELQLHWRGSTASPIQGPAGNKEYLALVERHRG